MITIIKSGLNGVDFINDRVTILAYDSSGVIITCKLYGDGRLQTFFEADDHYEEQDLHPETEKEIRAFL